MEFKLPNGFYDYVDNEVEKREKVYQEFLEVVKCYHFQKVKASVVGYADDFLSFGTAAQNRSYCFGGALKDKYMLGSDSLATMLRIYKNKFISKGAVRLVGIIPVFRHRKKKYKNWDHLIYTMINEKNDIYNDYLIIHLANKFLEKYYDNLLFTINFYGFFELAANEYGVERDKIFDLLYQRYILKKDYQEITFTQQNILRFIQSLERLEEVSYTSVEALDYIGELYPFTEKLVEQYIQYIQLLNRDKISYVISWINYCSVEYCSGIAFQVFVDERSRKMGDGGGYHYMAHKSIDSIETCYSFATSLEFMIETCRIECATHLILYVIKEDCSILFFQQICKQLRIHGYEVHEVIGNESLRKKLSKLPKHSSYCVVGSIEETQRFIIYNNEMIIVKE